MSPAAVYGMQTVSVTCLVIVDYDVYPLGRRLYAQKYTYSEILYLCPTRAESQPSLL